MNTKSLLSLITLTLSLVACGGGGSSGPVASSQTFQVWQAWVNYSSSSATRNFTVSGRSSGVDVSGSGTATTGSLTASTFEGTSAQRRTTVISGSIIASGNTTPYNATSTFYFDSNYLPLGYSSSSEYGVVTGSVNIPQTARVNDTAVIYTLNRYPSSAKTSRLGTSEISIAILPDSADTALLKVINIEKSTAGALQSTTTQTFRMTPAGALTAISEETVEGSTVLTLRY